MCHIVVPVTKTSSSLAVAASRRNHQGQYPNGVIVVVNDALVLQSDENVKQLYIYITLIHINQSLPLSGSIGTHST